MPVPFNKYQKYFNEHSEEQYLKLEQQYLNLYIFLQSLLTITEGEDLDDDSNKIIHFNVLCKRINQGVEDYYDFTQQVRDSMFKGDSATTSSYPESAGVVVWCTKEERELMIEALEHIANSFPDLKKANEFNELAKDLIKSRSNES